MSAANRLLVPLALAATIVAPSAITPAHADEGQWMPKQIAELDAAELKRLGLELTTEQIWNPDDFGLMAAIVNFGGCSSGFISPQGLIATNHHCAYGAIQANSSVEHDYLADGFFAATLGDELQAKGKTVKVLEKITDVTEQVHAAMEGVTEPAARERAARIAERKLVAECEKGDNRSCTVATFYNGSEIQLHEYLELEDVRLVYAPPSGVGNYGGEVDNWMWPRHSGDYSLLRAYVGPDGKPAPYSEDNVPYEPVRHLEVGTEGVSPGSFVAVLGFPGHTDRYLPAAEMRRQLEQFLPRRVELYGEWIQILEEEGARDPAVKIKVAAKLRGLANRHKNSRGMIEGIRRDRLLARREAEQEALAKWAEGQSGKYDDVLPGLDQLADARRETFEADFLLDNAGRGAGTLATAIDLVRRAREKTKPDLERESTYMDRGEKRLWSTIEGRLRDYDRTVDQRLMEAVFARVEKLPEGQRFSGMGKGDVAAYLAKTKLADETVVQGLFDRADPVELEASRDPMIALARELVTAIEARELEDDARGGRMRVLGPKYFEMLRAIRKGPVYPDANGTLRFSYATIKGYAPRDGMSATPQTTLKGQVAKATGEEPFNLPQDVIDAAPKAGETNWADPGLGDVPVCFLATGDTTGGNSGSPMIDGKGRWIGLNFDRVWENIAGDFGYDMTRSRNIGVDVRYLMWNLDVVDGATRLLEEMGVADKRGAGPRTTGSVPNNSDPVPGVVAPTAPGQPAEVGTPLKDADKADGAPRAAATGGCACTTGQGGRLGWLLGGLLLLGRLTRAGRSGT